MTHDEINEQAKEARSALIAALKKELLGPGSENEIPDAAHEIITDLPETRYSVGILFPQNNLYTGVESASSDESDDGGEDAAPEEQGNRPAHGPSNDEEPSLSEEINLSAQRLPSSMGCTFFVRGTMAPIPVHITFGTYRSAEVQDCTAPLRAAGMPDGRLPADLSRHFTYDRENERLHFVPTLNKEEAKKACDEFIAAAEDVPLKGAVAILRRQCRDRVYVRRPHALDVMLVLDRENAPDQSLPIDGSPLRLTARCRAVTKEISAVTVMLVNTEEGGYHGTNSIFQPQITVHVTRDLTYRFCNYTGLSHSYAQDDEEASLSLLYRDKNVYGTGHGVSVGWSIDTDGCGRLSTDFFPQIEVPQMDFAAEKDVDPRCLSMKYLSDLDDAPPTDKIAAMTSLIASYETWVDALAGKISAFPKSLRSAAERHIASCRETGARMRDGVLLLGQNRTAADAFRLANRAIFMQRIHLGFQKGDVYPGDEDLAQRLRTLRYDTVEEPHRWRPFQLAFLLMSLPSIVDPARSDRDLVDLIWFPTGGGKTEAYLGLTAFTIFYRRLAYPDIADGTAVMMRYTMRLLAAQQFIRAATLICACEAIRTDMSGQYPSYPLGNERISIGLWIGSSQTPNRNKEAKDDLDELMNVRHQGALEEMKKRHNHFQLLKCPWCGTKLVKEVQENRIVGAWGYRMTAKSAFYLCCPQHSCAYARELPIQIVDEELYRRPPTLLFGTVDKFALLPWKGEVGKFFAADSGNRAPELIIQDELHLISGPLGTIVGLYETAVDALCCAKGVKPKIIASTATIRKAKEQCAFLYNRDMRQFPPPGLDSGDSYFAREADQRAFGRVYIGLLPSGRTKMRMEVRLLAAILQLVSMQELPDEVKDKFWTLAVYFNSLRDLGSCRTLLTDSVKDTIKSMARRRGAEIRYIGIPVELTSRVSASELTKSLERLERGEYAADAPGNAVDTVLATNMISVGVDVARLNLMLIVEQPKLTGEYIQASSRIGRTHPGTAIILYNSTRSRDRSHYEQFKAYHESFYRFVEPTGITPFSAPACDRALHAVAIAMVRQMYGLADDAAAAGFDRVQMREETDAVRQYILARVASVGARLGGSNTAPLDEIEARIDAVFEIWHARAAEAEGENFCYGTLGSVRPAEKKYLLKSFGQMPDDPAFDTMNSMRSVDQSIAANILVWEDDDV